MKNKQRVVEREQLYAKILSCNQRKEEKQKGKKEYECSRGAAGNKYYFVRMQSVKKMIRWKTDLEPLPNVYLHQ